MENSFEKYKAKLEIIKAEEKMDKEVKSVILELFNDIISELDNLKEILDDVLLDYEEESDFDINCPYCNHNFYVELEMIDKPISCPECNNLIEFEISNEYNGKYEEETKDCSGCCKDKYGKCPKEKTEDNKEN